jgi:intein/homing endonuclease
MKNELKRQVTTPANLVANRIFIKPGVRYDFSDRPFMVQIFDDKHPVIGLKTARQISKTVDVSSLILMRDGSSRAAGEVVVGDEVACLEMPLGAKTSYGRVAWVSDRHIKPHLRVTTRLGSVIDVATTHPVRLWDEWRKAGDLVVGDRIASVRRAGEFLGDSAISDERVRFTAYMIGDGHIGSEYFNFTQMPGPSLDEFLRDLDSVGVTYKLRQKTGTACMSVVLHRKGPVRSWMDEDGLTDTRSATKFVPNWVFRLDRRQTALFINRLWSTDGTVKKPRPSQYQISYCTTSKPLAKHLRALLWKFGIQCSVKTREAFARLGDGRRVAGAVSHIVRVETRDGVRRFLSEIGALGKSESVERPVGMSNNNRDTYPAKAGECIEAISKTAGYDGNKGVPHDGTSLLAAGLRRKPGYPLTREKLRRYIDHFRSLDRYDQSLVEKLACHLDSDIAWDEITSIEKIGDRECVDFEVESHHNFIVDGIVTHNSTYLAADALISCEALAPYTVLTLTPSQDQTSKFSYDRLGPTIKDSPALRAMMSADSLNNVFEKSFSNGSKIYLSYAKDNADRARGITADQIDYDEVQDMSLGPVEAVTRPSMFTSRYKRVRYGGTPKSMSNGIEQRVWRQSDRREWMVRCRSHGPKPYHQRLTMKNVGLAGPICDKCGRALNTLDGIWVATSSVTAEGRVPHIHGYHVPQIIFPTTDFEVSPGKFGFLDWDQFKRDVETGDPAVVDNEIFGESADSEERPVKRDELQAICDESRDMPESWQEWMNGEYLFAGVDWGTGLQSATVLVIGQFDPKTQDVFRLVYAKRYWGRDADPKSCIPDILRKMSDFRVFRCHADFGSGLGLNSQIEQARGEEFLTTNYWSGSIGGKRVVYDQDLRRYVLNRSVHLTRFFQAVKSRSIRTAFRWKDFEIFAQDVLHVFREERKNGDPYYDHKSNEPDDSMHAMIYAWLVASFWRYRHEGVETARARHDPQLG